MKRPFNYRAGSTRKRLPPYRRSSARTVSVMIRPQLCLELRASRASRYSLSLPIVRRSSGDVIYRYRKIHMPCANRITNIACDASNWFHVCRAARDMQPKHAPIDKPFCKPEASTGKQRVPPTLARLLPLPDTRRADTSSTRSGRAICGVGIFSAFGHSSSARPAQTAGACPLGIAHAPSGPS